MYLYGCLWMDILHVRAASVIFIEPLCGVRESAITVEFHVCVEDSTS